MSELARRRLARASRNWFCDTELATTADSYVRHLSQQGYASGTIDAWGASHILRIGARGFTLAFL
jgi:hypothetical protein